MQDETNPPLTTSPKGSLVLSLNDRQVGKLILTLLSHYWTADDDPALRELQAEDWLESLEEFTLEDIRAACRVWRDTQTHRPTIARIRELARANALARIKQLPEPEPRRWLSIDDDGCEQECRRRYGPDHCRARFAARKHTCGLPCRANIPESDRPIRWS
jgi:hypothetical protein